MPIPMRFRVRVAGTVLLVAASLGPAPPAASARHAESVPAASARHAQAVSAASARHAQAVSAASASEASSYGAAADSVDLASLIESYNLKIERTADAIDSLTVRQEMIEPQPDGSVRTATAVLAYGKGGEMQREELSSDLAYPAGEYRLQSLIGPLLAPAEYAVSLGGVEEMEGHRCYRLDVRALVRDADHFDGVVWISTADPGPVRIVGEVADPPFPAVWIRLDKTFERHPNGVWLLHRHTGEVEVSLLVARKKGLRHIFYEEYSIECEGPGDELDY